MPRLPKPGADVGNWGDILNEYLRVSISDDGKLKQNSVTNTAIVNGAVTGAKLADDTIELTKLSSGVQTVLNNKVNNSSVGVASGIATLGNDAKLLENQLPTRLGVEELNDTIVTTAFGQKIIGELPAGLGWNTSLWPIAPELNLTWDGRMVGSAGITPEQIFDARSTARSAPDRTYYVAGNGSDSNPGTSVAPYRSIRRAIQQFNTDTIGTQTGKIVLLCVGIDTSWTHEYGFETDSSTQSARDLAIVAQGGRPVVGPWVSLLTPTLNTSSTNLATDPGAAGTAAFTSGNANVTVSTSGALSGASSATSARATVNTTGATTRVSAGVTLGLGFPNAGQLVRVKFKMKSSSATLAPEISFRPQASTTTGRQVLRASSAIGDTAVHSYQYDFYVPNGATLTASAGIWVAPSSASVNAGDTVDITDVSLQVLWATTDASSPPPRDDTFTACYAMPYSDNVKVPIRVLDLASADANGVAPDLTPASSAAACQATAGTWFFVAGTSDSPVGSLLIHRKDDLPVTNATTLVTVKKLGFLSQNNVNLWFENIDFVGGRGGGIIAVGPGSLSPIPLAFVMKGCTLSYGGGWSTVDLDNNAISIVNMEGIAAFFDCHVKGTMADAFNAHANSSSQVNAAFLTVNCSAVETGTNGTSRNGWTLHETVKGIDIAGVYSRSHGGTIHNIATSKAYMLGTISEKDYGDIAMGGSIPPVQFRAAQSAEMWLDYCIADGLPGAISFEADSSTSKIHRRRPQPTRLRTIDTGLIDIY